MSYHFLQASDTGYWAHKSSETIPSVLLKSLITKEKCSFSVNETDCFQDSQSGTTLEPSKVPSGEAKSMLLLEDSLVKMSQVWVRAMDYWARNQGYGAKWHGLSAKLDLRTYLWRMDGFSLDADYQELLLIWPLSGMMLDGVVWEQKMLAPLISVSGSGFWPTPTKQIMARRITAKKAHWKSNDGMTLLDAVILRKHLDPNQGFLLDAGLMNPDWLDWLMGAPIGWSGLRPLGMDKYHRWLQLCGIY